MGRAVIMGDEDVRGLLRTTLVAAGFDVVATAADAPAVVSCWDDHRPDVTVVGLGAADGPTGLDAAAHIRALDAAARLVLFSAWLDDATRARAGDLGVRCASADDLARLTREVVTAA